MTSDWPAIRLEEITTLLGDGLHGTPVYDQVGEYFFINGSNLKDGRIEINETTKRVSLDEFKKHKKQLNDRTILVSINGTLGNVALYRGEPVILGKSACYLNIKDEIDKNFVRYVLDSNIFQSYISNLATGSTIKNVSLKLMRDFTFKLPPLSIQKKIACILSTIDDRVTLLRETNQTLDAIAQALFKSWFINFDPVYAKQKGIRPEGIDEVTSRLFPECFEQSELGDIPKGWKIAKLKDFAKLKGGKMLEKNLFVMDGPYPVFGGAGEMARAELSNAEGFIITVGRVGAYCGQFFWHNGKAWINNNASLIVPNNIDYSIWLYLWLCNVNMDLIKKGAAQPFVSNGDIENLKMILPTPDIIQKFTDISTPIFNRISSASSAILYLNNLRDLLLPRLISSKIKLPDMEGQIEVAA